VDPFDAGSGMIAGTLDGTAIGSPLATGCHAGLSEDGTTPIVQFLAYMSDDTVLVASMVIPDPGLFTPGVDIPLGLGAVFGYFARYDVATETDEIIGLLIDGNLRFEEAGTGDGDSLRGTFTSRVIDMGF
jgi:hypothetical protein